MPVRPDVKAPLFDPESTSVFDNPAESLIKTIAGLLQGDETDVSQIVPVGMAAKAGKGAARRALSGAEVLKKRAGKKGVAGQRVFRSKEAEDLLTANPDDMTVGFGDLLRRAEELIQLNKQLVKKARPKK